ncbi:MAG: flagellar hook-basal body complex protein FliE [Myxococcota bacterium]
MTVGITAAQAVFERVELRNERAEAPSASSSSSFADALEQFVEKVDESQRVAETKSADFAEGRTNDIHGTMIALQRADVSLRLLGSVRNRALEAYREVMRMGA